MMDTLTLASIVQAASTLFLVGITFYYAIQTYRTVQEMREARDQETAPSVVVYFDIPYGKELIYFVIKNLGKSMAENVKLEFVPPLQGDEFIQNIKKAWIENIIPSLPPNYEVRTVFDEYLSYSHSGRPLRFDVSVSYYGGISKVQRSAHYTLDLSAYMSLGFEKQVDIGDITKQMQKLNSTLAESVVVLQKLSTVEAAIRHLRPTFFDGTHTMPGIVLPEPSHYDLLMKLVHYQKEHGTTRFEFAVHQGDDYKTLFAQAMRGEGPEVEAEIFSHPNIDPLILWREDQYIRITEQIKDILYYVRLTPAALQLEEQSGKSFLKHAGKVEKSANKPPQAIQPTGFWTFMLHLWRGK